MSNVLSRKLRPSIVGTVSFLCLLASVSGYAQVQSTSTPASSSSPAGTVAALENPLPDAPSAAASAQQSAGQANTQPAASPAPVQTKRILGIIPNFRSVTADTILPPQTAREKFTAAARDSFDYGSFILAAVQAGIAMNGDSYPEFHQGVVGYGRYYWHNLADTATENFMVAGAGPVIFHQDSRFYTLGHGSVAHRAEYAATRVLITRKDDGGRAINFSEIVGAGAASGLSSTYYPTKYQTWTKVGQKWLTGMIIDGASFTVKEFWPDINRKLAQSMHRQ